MSTPKLREHLPKRKPSRIPSQRFRNIDADELDSNIDEEVAQLGDTLLRDDLSHRSELDYEGYSSLEESDNDSYNSLDAERSENSSDEVILVERESESDEDLGEEDLVDPQENRK